MKPGTDFDAYLTRQMTDAPLPDEGFTRAVTARMERDRRRRLWALTGAVAVASVSAAIATSLAPMPTLPFPAITPEAIVAALCLATACSLVWIDTESRPPMRTESHCTAVRGGRS